MNYIDKYINNIIFENKNNGNLFHLSESNLDGEILKPRIPDNYMTKNNFEDNETKRISFSTSIDGCLIAMGKNLKNKIFNVHIPSKPINEKYIINTKELENKVPDVHLTNEVWVIKPVKLKYIYQIKVLKPNKSFKYTFGKNKKATTYSWEYKIVSNSKE